jgi:hypothetical protein
MSGKETFNSARNTAETKSEDDVLVGYLAGFAEIHLHENIRIGASYVPYVIESETTENKREAVGKGDETGGIGTQKVQVDIENFLSAYLSFHYPVMGQSVFARVGVLQADLVTNENLSTGSKYPDADLEGITAGIGVERDTANGLFIRAEVNVTEYDDIKLTSTGSDNTNVIDVTGLSGIGGQISVGKTF